MSKKDWNYFSFNGPSEGEAAFSGIGHDENIYKVSPGGNGRSLDCVHANWVGATPNPIFGYMYDGPDIGKFPILDTSMAIALRTHIKYAECVGMIIRSQANLSGTILNQNQLNYYMIGVRFDSTTNDNVGVIGVYKIVNGVPNLLSTNSVGVVDYGSDFVQIEYKVVSDGSSNWITGRKNTASQLTNPGDPGWTSFDLTQDVTPGILIGAGFCGFGVMWRSTGTYDGDYNFDRIKITREIIW